MVIVWDLLQGIFMGQVSKYLAWEAVVPGVLARALVGPSWSWGPGGEQLPLLLGHRGGYWNLQLRRRRRLARRREVDGLRGDVGQGLTPGRPILLDRVAAVWKRRAGFEPMILRSKQCLVNFGCVSCHPTHHVLYLKLWAAIFLGNLEIAFRIGCTNLRSKEINWELMKRSL